METKFIATLQFKLKTDECLKEVSEEEILARVKKYLQIYALQLEVDYLKIESTGTVIELKKEEVIEMTFDQAMQLLYENDYYQVSWLSLSDSLKDKGLKGNDRDPLINKEANTYAFLNNNSDIYVFGTKEEVIAFAKSREE